jgi:glycosyltransferase involved in cell wall biosynthesis
LPWPPGFGSQRRREREWLSYLRVAYKLLPGYRSLRTQAAALIIGSQNTYRQMPRQCRPRCFYIPENAVDLERFGPPPQRSVPSRPLRAIFVGRLVPYKGADLLLEAVTPLLKRGDLTLDIVGTGPQMPLLAAAVQRDSLAPCVRLRGHIDHRQIAQAMAGADVLVFPSVHEFGGGVVLEAMAQGTVPVVVGYGGPDELVSDKTGFRIELGSRAQIIERLRHLLGELVQQPQRIAQKSPAAVRRARGQFTWQSKARQVLEIYQWVLGRGGKPHFPMPVPDLDD